MVINAEIVAGHHNQISVLDAAHVINQCNNNVDNMASLWTASSSETKTSGDGINC